MALGTNDTSAEIPPLRPPRGELPPSFWEQHGLTIAVATCLGLLLLAVLVWLALRPKATIDIPPEEAARQELQSLRAHPADSQLLTRVSHVVRLYLTRAFELPREELTTAEFCQALQRQQKAGSELAGHAARVLHTWDEQKFSPAPPPPAEDPVREAGRIIDEGQARIAELRRQELSQANPEAGQQPA